MTTDRPTPSGCCADCAHVRSVAGSRGTTYYLCERSFRDDRYPRYPRLPVLSCSGHEVAPTTAPHRPGVDT